MPSTASLAPAARTRCSCHSRRWGSAPETRSSRPRSRFSPPLGRSTTPAGRPFSWTSSPGRSISIRRRWRQRSRRARGPSCRSTSTAKWPPWSGCSRSRAFGGSRSWRTPQAIGARRKIDGQWRMAGELGWATGYSFFPSKNLGAWGDGGMMVTSDDALAERLRKLRLHGGAKQYHHDEVGTNSRLDSMQAAVLLAKLPYLAAWSERRREHAATYTNALADVSEVRTPVVDACNEPIFHQYTLRVERRDDLQAHLKSKGVGNAVYYPVPLHLQNCFSDLGYKRGRLPEAERAAGEVISLPIYPELTRDQVDYVADMIRGFYR